MANELYINKLTTITWTDTAGDEVMDLGGLAADAVHVGSYHDWGVLPRPEWYDWVLKIDGFDTAPVVAEAIMLYIAESDDLTLWTGPEAPGDATSGAGNKDRLPNLHRVGPGAFVRSTTAGDDLVRRGTFRSTARYFAPVLWNNTADALLGTADAHQLKITPVYHQGQV